MGPRLLLYAFVLNHDWNRAKENPKSVCDTSYVRCTIFDTIRSRLALAKPIILAYQCISLSLSCLCRGGGQLDNAGGVCTGSHYRSWPLAWPLVSLGRHWGRDRVGVKTMAKPWCNFLLQPLGLDIVGNLSINAVNSCTTCCALRCDAYPEHQLSFVAHICGRIGAAATQS